MRTWWKASSEYPTVCPMMSSFLGHPGEPSSGQFRRVPSRPDAPGLETALLRVLLCSVLRSVIGCLELSSHRCRMDVSMGRSWRCVLRVPQVFASLPSPKAARAKAYKPPKPVPTKHKREENLSENVVLNFGDRKREDPQIPKGCGHLL